MRLVRLDSIREEMEIARDIPSAVLGALPLLRRGVRLSPSLADRLAARGVRAVWIEDGLGDGIIPAQPLPDHVRRSTEQAVGTCLRADSYTYSHSVRVATLGLLLGQRINRLDGWIDWRGQRRYDRSAERMTELAMGLLIHDIGKISIPESVLNKPAKLTSEEWDLIKTHPSAGASMLSADRASALTICVVRESAGSQFDPGVVEHFLRVVMPYPVGYSIAMPGGGPAVVAGVDAERPDRPLVRYHDESGHVREAVLQVVDGEVRELDGTATR